MACREVKAKEELIRLVRNADKAVEVDIDGRKTGRGAYLCREQACWESGFNGGRLEYTLRTSLTEANRQELINFSKGLFRVDPKE
ncbi:MAG: YlxR family protein [Dehalococcoidales bacterium]